MRKTDNHPDFAYDITSLGSLGENEKKYILEKSQITPNRLTAKILLCAIIVIAINWILNELGAYRVEDSLMRAGSAVAILLLALPQLVLLKPRVLADRRTKYVMMTCAILAVFLVTYLMSFHTTLCLVLPMLLATLYRSDKLAVYSTVGSILITILSPITSYLSGTWDTLFLRVLLQLSGFDSVPSEAMVFSTEQSVGQIFLYLAVPRMLVVIAVGIVTISIVKNNKRAMEDRILLMRNTNRILNMQSDMLDGFATVIESRDGSTGTHVTKTKEYVTMIFDRILEKNLYPELVTRDYADMVIKASVLHDIGKISIPDEILKKPGKFTEEEYAIMKEHTVSGDKMVRKAFGIRSDREFSAIVHEVVYSHHEKYNGSGYPDGLNGDQIPFSARVMAIADAFDAMTSVRVYKQAIPVKEALERLNTDAGSHFDPELVKIFVEAYTEKFNTIQ